MRRGRERPVRLGRAPGAVRRRRHTQSTILRAVREVAAGSVAETCGRYGISRATLFRWKRQFGAHADTLQQRIDELEAALARCRRQTARQADELEALRAVLRDG
ncbi:MAG TPA: transposase [Candidatus Elarobacter sp.]|nr:transposase [Candidatus Elarobacter sp.]